MKPAIPFPPNFEARAFNDFNFELIAANINQRMLYNKHLGIKDDIAELERSRDAKFLALKNQAESLLKEAFGAGVIKPTAAFRFLPAQSEGDTIRVYNPSKKYEPEIFNFPRQEDGGRLCLSDFILPAETGAMDYVAVFACSCGSGAAKAAEKFKNSGELVKSHLINILAIVCAEAAAEALHALIRKLWGFPDPDGITLRDKLAGNYQGKRFSPGYPAFPGLEAQPKIFRLLAPETAGITLTENYMMDPEASVSALVFHAKEVHYFDV